MARFTLGDPRAHFAFQLGDIVAFKTEGGSVDPAYFGRIVDGWQDGQLSGSRAAPVYRIELDGRPDMFFNAEELRLVKPDKETVIRLKIRRKLAAGSPRAFRLAERIVPGTTPPDAAAYGMGSGHPCEACDEPISPTQTQVSYPRKNAEPVRFHDRCDTLWREEALK